MGLSGFVDIDSHVAGVKGVRGLRHAAGGPLNVYVLAPDISLLVVSTYVVVPWGDMVLSW